METTALQIFHGYILPIIGTAISSLGVLAIGYLADWLRTKTHDAKVQAFLGKLQFAAEDAVREAAQTTVARLQKEGRWDANTAAAVRDSVLDVVKRHLGSDEIVSGAKALRIPAAAVEDRIRTIVEAAVHRMKESTQPRTIVNTTAVQKG